jgi:hypothetical protein
MALHGEIIELFESVLRTEADFAAFNEGYKVGVDPSTEAKMEGPVVPRFYGGLSVVHSPNAAGEDRRMYVNEPAFVLGAAVAGCKFLQDRERVVTPLEASIGAHNESKVGTIVRDHNS